HHSATRAPARGARHHRYLTHTTHRAGLEPSALRCADGGRPDMATLSTPRITRTDSKVGRFYDITHADGTTARYPSVTSILGAINKPALIPWAAKEERTACAGA